MDDSREPEKTEYGISESRIEKNFEEYRFPSKTALGMAAFAVVFALIFIIASTVSLTAHKKITIDNYADYLQVDIAFLTVVSPSSGFMTTVTFKNRTKYNLNDVVINYKITDKDNNDYGDFSYSDNFSRNEIKRRTHYFTEIPTQYPQPTIRIVKITVTACTGGAEL